MFWICSIWLLQIDVNGKNTAPVYKFWKSEKGGYFGVAIKWNFTKSLVHKGGKVVKRRAPTTSPLKIEVRSFVFPITTFESQEFLWTSSDIPSFKKTYRICWDLPKEQGLTVTLESQVAFQLPANIDLFSYFNRHKFAPCIFFYFHYILKMKPKGYFLLWISFFHIDNISN